MRGGDARTEALFSYVSCEARVPMDHPLRAIRKIVNAALTALSAEFEKLYAKSGRPSIPPEKLLRALLLQAFYSVRSERQLMEQLDYAFRRSPTGWQSSVARSHRRDDRPRCRRQQRRPGRLCRNSNPQIFDHPARPRR